MLQSLHVKNLALIDEIEVEFEKGLNILTGETGAGKSIILGSVNLALGGRYTKDILREGAGYGLVELSFFIENESQRRVLESMDIFPEEGTVTLTRRLMPSRSVCRINGETVSVQKIREISEILIDIHGQHEHQSLLNKKNHLQMIDAYAGNRISSLLTIVKDSYQEYKKLYKELQEADMDASARAKELSFLQFEVDEIEKANLIAGEDEELETDYKKMSNGKKIADSVQEAYGYTGGMGDCASDLISRAIHAISDITGFDEHAKELSDQLVEIDNLLNDFNHDLSAYQSECEFSDEELYEVENRLNEINRLKTKYGYTISDILAYKEKQMDRIAILEDYDLYLDTLRKKVAKAKEQLLEQSLKLSKIRKEEAKKFEKLIRKGMEDLNFEASVFSVHFDMLEEAGPLGMDSVEFMVALNQGQPARPLIHVASGGELSRIMLVIKSVMADKDEIETLIFDEIDVGISGRTAQKVSEKMGLLGKNHQVICITHLAQIASMSDTHFLIKKSSVSGDTKTSITKLNETEVVQELARILGGVKITDLVFENAQEMRNLAKEIKTRPV
ncbi:MAG: DNA repair protein RecN [Dorea sp.]|nr:DNA repair protein RecN [Dorea sp.]